jgi:putative ABC transport system permease protein
LLVRWSLRDLRRRWVLVAAIALIIALGTGTYAALGSTATWRRQSNDASFGRLHMHDLRVTLAQGATVPAGALDAVVRTLPHASLVGASRERLVGSIQVDASNNGKTILVPGQLVGVDPGASGVDDLYVTEGRSLQARDRDRNLGVLEHQFANHYDLPSTGSIRVSGGVELPYVGVGTSPQHFVVVGRTGGLFAQGSNAVVFVPLSTAQSVLHQVGAVNELVLRVRAPDDTATLERELTEALARELPETGTTITRRADEPAYRMLYEDIENDQQFWNIIALLILAGAAFAAFNLTTRMVEAQRREIGVGMAIGVSPRRLALRPAFVGVEIAALGAVAGVAVGYGLTVWLRGVFETVLPLPEWRTPFQAATFARAGIIGLVLPFVATAIPVWRAVRVEPVDAIRTGNRAARRSGFAGLVARLHLPGRSYRQLPLRNLVRTPRRTVLTALAIGAAITTLVGTIGLIDSLLRTIDRGEAELSRRGADRLAVELDTFYPRAAPQVLGVTGSAAVGAARPELRLFGTLEPDGADIDVLVDLVDFADALWTPTLADGSVRAVREGGIVLAEKAADDLGVRIGDLVTFRHPERRGLTSQLVTDRIPVAGIHPGPLRPVAYLDIGQAGLFNLEGLTNFVEVQPATGVSEDAAVRAIFSQPGVASVQAVIASTRQFRDALDQYFSVLRVAELIVLALAVLIAFNSSSISMDERSREHATMLAFGLRTRTVLGMAVLESALVGALGTAIGIGLGYQVVRWVMAVQLEDTMPDLAVQGFVSTTTMLTAVVFGVVGVALAPLFTARRVRRMDIPATLRVME